MKASIFTFLRLNVRLFKYGRGDYCYSVIMKVLKVQFLEVYAYTKHNPVSL